MIKPLKNPAILGVGNALTDVIFRLENDSLLHEFNLPKGSMTLVDASLSRKIYDAAVQYPFEVSTGGSAANTVRSLAGLGASCGYLGKIGDDSLGKVFRETFLKQGIKPHLSFSESETGRVMALVTPDSERTMATFLGAAAGLTPADFNTTVLQDYGLMYMEGYLVQNHDLIRTGFEMAKQNGLVTAIDLASFNVVEANLDFLKKLILDYVDIVFANEEEAFAFTRKSPEKAVGDLADLCDLAVVKMGKEGSLIQSGSEKVTTGVFAAKAIDTTGAGDSYAAGFLFGLTHGFSLEKCGKIAALVSSKVVEIPGANLPDTAWKKLKDEIASW